MSPQRWATIKEVFSTALEKPEAERLAFLDSACNGDAELRAEVERLLAASDTATLDSPAGNFLNAAGRELKPGDTVAHYRIEARLGEGGMGVVYKARDIDLGRFVAIKFLRAADLIDDERVRRFTQEARTASALNHPNIVTIHEIAIHEGAPFIVMEYVPGKSLDQIISRSGLRVGEVLKLGSQVAGAVAAAAAAGVIHRDLKPANVMVTDSGNVKVVDFGLAKLAKRTEGEATQTEAGAILGTISYMSPEQAEGKPVDPRSDIFSFGAVLYEMATGQRAFRGDTAMSTISAILRDEPKPVSQIVAGIPRDLEKIITRCLRKDPDRRFQHMADVRVALLELKEESESGRMPEAPVAPPRKRTWQWAGVAASVLAVLGAGLGLMRWRNSPLPPQTLVALTTDAGSQTQPSFSPDGRQVAFVWDGEKGGKYGIYVKMLGETQALRLTNPTTNSWLPAWSPDGKRIAFCRGGIEGGMYTVSALGGAERKLNNLPCFYNMSWSPDGKWLASAQNNKERRGIFLAQVDGEELRRITDPKAPELDLAPVFSHDGHRLAYVGCKGQFDCDLYIQELDSGDSPHGSPRQVTRQGVFITGITWHRDGESLIYSASHSVNNIYYLWQTGIDGRQPPLRLDIAGPRASGPTASPTTNRLVFSRGLSDPDIWRYQVNGRMEPLIASSLPDYNPRFSPDGTKIAFESSRSGEAQEIWVAQSDGSNPVQLTNRLGRHQGTPRWSPDGRWIAFDSQSQDGRQDTYVMNAAGGPPRKLTFGQSNENVPSWSSDGKWIYFHSNRTGSDQIWRVLFAGGTPEQVTTSGGFISHESVDGQTLFYMKVIPSGPLFAMALPAGVEHQVLPYVQGKAFDVVAEGIYYIGRPSGESTPLEFYQFSTKSSRLVTRIEGRTSAGLSISPDKQTILFSRFGAVAAHLMMIENFQ